MPTARTSLRLDRYPCWKLQCDLRTRFVCDDCAEEGAEAAQENRRGVC